jgi:uncharacterized protein YyaL (SSP411 family)
MKERLRGDSWKINWNSWSKEIFERSSKENKLILLSLSAVWCHWCHVMDETTYSEPEIIRTINENFIPVRVDVDQRPDIAERYNFGGYPTFAFLNSKGDIILGGTYVPPEQFKEILKEVVELAKNEDLNKETTSVIQSIFKPSETEPNQKVIWDILDLVTTMYDRVYGGFGVQPKFPIPDALLFLENMYILTNQQGIKTMVCKTLDNIVNGLFDKEEGGFFRYSVTRDWSTPHYEKMLDTNSNLLLIYSNAFILFHEEKYLKIANKTFEYILNKLYDKNEKLFYGSQDADEEYYKLSLSERKKVKEPIVDKTFYAYQNSLCADSILRFGIITENKELIELSKEVTYKIIEKFYNDKGITHIQNEKLYLLNDNIYFLKLLLDLYQTTFEEIFLKKANEIANKIIENFFDKNFFLLKDKIETQEDFGLLKEPYFPIHENSLAVAELKILGEIQRNEAFSNFSKKIASVLSSIYQKYSIFASQLGSSLILYLNPIEIKLVSEEKTKYENLLIKNKIIIYPNVFITYTKPNEVYSKEGIYVCKDNLCYPPIQNEDELIKLIRKINYEFINY